MLLQEYRFDIRFIPGKNNVVADALSRLCLNLGMSQDPAIAGSELDETDVTATFATERLAAMFEIEDEGQRQDASFTTHNGTFQYMEALMEQGYKFENQDISIQQSALDATVEEMFCEMRTIEEDVVIADDEMNFPDELYEQIKLGHNAMRGHHGVLSTIRKLKELGIKFKHMRQWVDKFIKLCPTCNKTDETSFHIATMPYTLATYRAMQNLQLDAIGPLREDADGNRYVLVIIDTFSRWVMLYPTHSTDAKACVRAIIQHIGIFGAPNQVCTDGGSQLDNATVRAALELMGTLHHIGIAYSSEEQGIVERENREVLKHLRNFLFDTRQGIQWSMALPFVQRILNAEVVSSIGHRPAELIFGNAINLDRGIFVPNKIVECSHSKTNFPEYIDQLIKAQKEALESARLRQRSLDLKHLRERAGEEPTVFKVGSLVLLEYAKGLNGKKPPHKLMTRLRGPYVVRAHTGSEYTVRHLASNNIQIVHVTRLRPFEYDSKRTDPNVVAATDIDEFLVARILDHRPKTKRSKRSEMEFFVQWDGYDTTHDTWEPWAVLKNNSIVHAYCIEHGMKSFIPKSIKETESSDEGF